MYNEDKYEELVEDCISKKDLADVIQVTLERLMIEIKAEDSDKLVRSFSMYLHKFVTNKVKELDNIYSMLSVKVDDLEDKLNKLDNICVEQYDVLEAKNYQLKVDSDSLDTDNFQIRHDLDKSIIQTNIRYNNLCNHNSDITDKLNDRCDDLEAKNYQLKADMDRIINNINLNNKGGEWWQCIAEGTT